LYTHGFVDGRALFGVQKRYAGGTTVKKFTLMMLAATVISAGCNQSHNDQNAPEAAAPATGASAAAETGGGKDVAKKASEAVGIPTYREVTLPAGTTLPLDLQTAVASDTSQVEDSVRATLRRAITVQGKQVLPAGTEVVGTVTDVERAGRVKGRSRVAFRFTSLRHANERYDISTESVARVGEATKGEDATKIGVGAGAGAVIGGILGGKGGAAKGAAIGGAGGTGVVLATRGKEVRLGTGADVNTKLTAPLTIRVKIS
jgi:hypothetical protein